MYQILEPLVKYINYLLIFFYELTGNYGLAIILLALVVNLVTFPLTKKQITASRKLQELQPELKKLQEKYKGDKEKYNQATMEYMRENKVNPLGGCLPLLIQLPIIISVFQLLRDPAATEMIENTFFLGLDLQLTATEAGKYFKYINPYYILPVISAGATFFHQRLVLTDPKQKMMLYIFPVMILVISVGFPAGLVLYWTTNSFFSVGNHFLIKATTKEEDKGAEKKVAGGEKRAGEKNEAAIAEKQRPKTLQERKKTGTGKSKDIHKSGAPNKKKKAKGKKKGAGKGR